MQFEGPASLFLHTRKHTLTLIIRDRFALDEGSRENWEALAAYVSSVLGISDVDGSSGEDALIAKGKELADEVFVYGQLQKDLDLLLPRINSTIHSFSKEIVCSFLLL